MWRTKPNDLSIKRLMWFKVKTKQRIFVVLPSCPQCPASHPAAASAAAGGRQGELAGTVPSHIPACSHHLLATTVHLRMWYTLHSYKLSRTENVNPGGTVSKQYLYLVSLVLLPSKTSHRKLTIKDAEGKL